MHGQYSNPVRVIGFSIAEGWVRDVSEDVALELRVRYGDQDPHMPVSWSAVRPCDSRRHERDTNSLGKCEQF